MNQNVIFARLLIVRRLVAKKFLQTEIICLYNNCHLSIIMRLIKAKIFSGVSFSNASIRRPASGNHIIIGVGVCIVNAKFLFFKRIFCFLNWRPLKIRETKIKKCSDIIYIGTFKIKILKINF